MAFLVAVIALVPLLITPGLLFYYDVTPKIAILLIGTASALVVWAFRRPGLRTLLSSRTGRLFCALLAAQAVSLAISGLFSTDPALSFGGTNWRRFGVISQSAVLVFAFLTASYAAFDRRNALRAIRWMAVCGIPAAGYGILQYFGWDPWIPAQSYHVGEGIWTIVRPPGTLGHADYFGAYCIYSFFTNLLLSLVETGRFPRAISIAGVVLSAAAVLLSGTRSAILGLAAGCVVLALWLRPWPKLRTAGFALGLTAAICAFYISPAGALLRARVHWAREDRSGGSRVLLWRDSLRMAARRPVVGYGPETFSLWFPRFQSVDLARALPDFYQESPHNAILDAFAAQGVAGPALLIALAGVGIAAAWRARRKTPRLSGGLAALLSAAIVSQQFNAFVMPTALYFYVTLALAVAVFSARRDEPGAVRRSAPLGVAAILPAMVFTAFALALLRADRVTAFVQKKVESGQIAEAVQQHDAFHRWRILGANPELWYSRKLAAAGQAAAAHRPALAAAATADDRQNACYNLAMFEAFRNDASATERSLRDAIAYAPNWYKPHAALAQLMRRTGRTSEANAEEAITRKLTNNLQLLPP